jgi:hypothetical protein
MAAYRTLPLSGVLLLALCLCFTGCSKAPTHESVAQDFTDKMKELGTTLKGVTDESSAKSAASKVTSIAADLKKLSEERAKLPKPTADQEKAMADKYTKPLMEAMGTVMNEGIRIQTNPTLATPLKGAMEELDKTMQSMK